MSGHPNYARVLNRPLTAQTDPGRFHSWNAWDDIFARYPFAVAVVARAVRLKGDTVKKWRHPFGGTMDTSGRKNVAHTLYDAINEMIRAGVPFWDAMQPVIWILHKFNLDPAPRVDGTERSHRPFEVLSGLALQAGIAQSKLAEFLDEKSRGGKRITLQERQELRPVVDALERNVREYRALVDVEAK